MNLKKYIITALAAGAVAFTGGIVQPVHAAIGFEAPAPAENLEKPATVTTQHHINIDGKVLEPVNGKQNVAYVDGQPLVALRQTAEALGYTVSWDAATKTALVDMSIATLAVQPDQAQVIRHGKLKVINLDVSESFLPTARTIDGQLFVSPKVFGLLLNDVKISKDEIFIAPQRAQLESTGSTNGISSFLPVEEDTTETTPQIATVKRTSTETTSETK